MLADATRIEHLFSAIGGKPEVLPGIKRNKVQVNDAGDILALLRGAMDREERADALAAIMLRHAAARLDPSELLLLLARAFRDAPPERIPATPASVARWIPAEVR